MALAAYRHLLRGISVAFKNDLPVQSQALLQARQGFDANRQLGTAEADGHIAHAEQVAALLRHNVVQGERMDKDGEERWHLKIRKDTELGDNESVKMGGNGAADGGCCQNQPR